MLYFIDNTPVRISIDGDIIKAPADPSPPHTEWKGAFGNEGFRVSPFIDAPNFSRLQSGLTEMVRAAVADVTKQNPDDFSLEKYHHYCRQQSHHLSVVNALRMRSDVSYLPIDYAIIDACVSERCQEDVTCRSPKYPASGFFFIRLIRPQPHMDNNPPHRDAWLDYLSEGINAYVPLAGSNAQSSLPVVSGSHRWDDRAMPRTGTGATVNGMTYTVPAALPDDAPLRMSRPETGLGDIMIFSPWLLHGGAVNFNTDTTRVSLEMRFWKR